jgi:hypothetical protein
MEDSYSVADAVRLTGHSESKVRRLVDAGVLTLLPDHRPLRLTRQSVDAERAAILTRLDAVERDALEPAGDRIEHLELRVIELSGALSDLTAAHSAVLDTFRRLSSDGVPNH